MSTQQTIEADLTWTGYRFERGVRIAVDGGGVITHVGTTDVEPTRRMMNTAILPGFINAHSHAFQRGLRGRGETFPEGAGSFWTWRDAMYGLVEQMTGPMLYDLSLQAFREMRLAGITCVGEFHYLHHDDTREDFSFDDVVLRAARDAGIRIVLLNAFYCCGGIDSRLEDRQRRFATPDHNAYWRQQDRLRKQLDARTQSLGIVAHSIRAVPIDDVASLQAGAELRGLPFHIHVEEQPREVIECIEHYGKPPMALLNERLIVCPDLTFVHCTHSTSADLVDFVDGGGGGNICICPLTEANLGDGLANVPHILANGGAICLGTDSNARISMIEEMRWLEYGQRLATKARGVCGNYEGKIARTLLDMATTNGARSLGLRAGRIAPGHHADLVAIDLSNPSLAGWTKDTLLESIIFGAGNSVISATCVNGDWD